MKTELAKLPSGKKAVSEEKVASKAKSMCFPDLPKKTKNSQQSSMNGQKQLSQAERSVATICQNAVPKPLDVNNTKLKEFLGINKFPTTKEGSTMMVTEVNYP